MMQLKMLESGENILHPLCHHVNAVGPMGGITFKNMPVLVVKTVRRATALIAR